MIASDVVFALSLIVLWLAGFSKPIVLGGWCIFAVLDLIAIMTYYRYAQNNMRAWRKKEEHVSKWEIGEGGVKIVGELATSELKWRAFEKIWKYPDVWLLFVAKHQFLILPTKVGTPELLDFIDHWIKIGSGGRPKCAKCGYDLRGQRETRCPECGTEFDRDKLKV